MNDEVRDHASVVRVHARAVRVEDTRDANVEFVLAIIIEEQSLGAAFAFIVAGARADRVDVAPIFLGLRVHVRIAVNLGRRCLEDLGADALGEAEHVDGAMHAGLGRLHGVVLVMHRRSGTREIVDLVDLDIEREGDVVAQ